MKKYFKNPALAMEGVTELSWDGFKRCLDTLFQGWASSNAAATKMLFDVFDEDDNAHLSFLELARCLALMTVRHNDAERTTFLFKRYARGPNGLSNDALTRMLCQTDSNTPEKMCRVLADHALQAMGHSAAHGLSEDEFKRTLNDGLSDSLRYFFSTCIAGRGTGGFGERRGGRGGRDFVDRGRGGRGRGRNGNDEFRKDRFRDTFGDNNWTEGVQQGGFPRQGGRGGRGGQGGRRGRGFGGGGGFAGGNGFGGRGRGRGRGGGGGRFYDNNY